MSTASPVFSPLWHFSGTRVQGCSDQDTALGCKKEGGKSAEDLSEGTTVTQIIEREKRRKLVDLKK